MGMVMRVVMRVVIRVGVIRLEMIAAITTVIIAVITTVITLINTPHTCGCVPVMVAVLSPYSLFGSSFCEILIMAPERAMRSLIMEPPRPINPATILSPTDISVLV